jgi:hypothetical protein
MMDGDVIQSKVVSARGCELCRVAAFALPGWRHVIREGARQHLWVANYSFEAWKFACAVVVDIDPSLPTMFTWKLKITQGPAVAGSSSVYTGKAHDVVQGAIICVGAEGSEPDLEDHREPYRSHVAQRWAHVLASRLRPRPTAPNIATEPEEVPF